MRGHLNRFMTGISLTLTIAVAGCSSSSQPAPLDAAGEQALAEDMKRVASEEQEHLRKSTQMAAPNAAEQAPNFFPEGEGRD